MAVENERRRKAGGQRGEKNLCKKKCTGKGSELNSLLTPSILGCCLSLVVSDMLEKKLCVWTECVHTLDFLYHCSYYVGLQLMIMSSPINLLIENNSVYKVAKIVSSFTSSEVLSSKNLCPTDQNLKVFNWQQNNVKHSEAANPHISVSKTCHVWHFHQMDY